ncbi:unnamed protein product [Gordionus sp. m RMFG-2023]
MDQVSSNKTILCITADSWSSYSSVFRHDCTLVTLCVTDNARNFLKAFRLFEKISEDEEDKIESLSLNEYCIIMEPIATSLTILENVSYVCTTADCWTHNRRAYLGVCKMITDNGSNFLKAFRIFGEDNNNNNTSNIPDKNIEDGEQEEDDEMEFEIIDVHDILGSSIKNHSSPSTPGKI